MIQVTKPLCDPITICLNVEVMRRVPNFRLERTVIGDSKHFEIAWKIVLTQVGEKADVST